MVIAAPPPPAAVAAVVPVASGSSSSVVTGPTPRGFPFGRPAQKAVVPDASVPDLEAVGVKLNEINSKPRKFKNDKADIQILIDLQGELPGSGKAGTAEQQARFKKLVIAFNYINKQEEGDHLTALRKELVPGVYAAVAAAPAPAAVAAPPAVQPSMMQQLKLEQERRKSQPNVAEKTAAAIAAIDQYRADKNDLVKAAIEQCVNGETGGISAIDDNRKAIGEAIGRLQILGDSATQNQKIVLKLLMKRLQDIRDDSGQKEEDDDDEFGPVRKNLSITSTPSPVPAQAAVTNAPVTVPTPVGASTLVNATNASKKSPQSAFKGFSPLPATGAGGGVVKKAVAAPKVAGLSSEEKAERRAALQTEIAELKAKIENGSANMKEKLRLTAANTELSNLG